MMNDLVGGTQSIYAGLHLDGWDAVQPKVEAYAAGSKNYETNKYPLTDELKAKVRERWGDIIGRQGYA
jgi:hypothetical protein